MASLLFNRLTMQCSQVKGREGGRLINLSLVKQTPDRLPLVLKLKSAWQLGIPEKNNQPGNLI
jgi:hypothetical protein